MAISLRSLIFPDDLPFSLLHLSREHNGDLRFDWQPVEALCEANGIHSDVLRDSPDDAIHALLKAWYRVHRGRGGEPDLVMDDLLFEMEMELRAGGFFYAPGSA